MRVLVTGGAGFIGSHLCDALLARGDEVYCVDNFNSFYVDQAGPRYANRKQENIADALRSDKFHLIPRDIAELDLEFPPQIDAIAHLAAIASVRAPIPYIEYERANVDSTKTILELARKHRVPHCVIASSSSVYTGHDVPWHEKLIITPNPNGKPYPETKKRLEEVARESFNKHPGNPSIIVIRPFTVYGPRNRPDMFMLRAIDAIENGTPLTLYQDDGKDYLRDYTYVDDVVEGFKAALKHHYLYEVINIGNNHPVFNTTLIAELEQICGKRAKLVIEDKKEMPATYAAVTRAKHLLGSWRPKVSLNEGLRRTVAWRREHPEPEPKHAETYTTQAVS